MHNREQDQRLVKKEERKPGNWWTLDQYLRRDKLLRPSKESDSKPKKEYVNYYG